MPSAVEYLSAETVESSSDSEDSDTQDSARRKSMLGFFMFMIDLCPLLCSEYSSAERSSSWSSSEDEQDKALQNGCPPNRSSSSPDGDSNDNTGGSGSGRPTSDGRGSNQDTPTDGGCGFGSEVTDLIQSLCSSGYLEQLQWLEAYLTDEARDRQLDGMYHRWVLA